ncbi:MAG: hypothetical protein IJO08_03935 [Clostridia bacterium]|nr:hypothetical protein [Clostridia bacterium]
MSKWAKIMVYIMLLLIVVYIVIMSFNSDEIINEENNYSGDIVSGEISSGDEISYAIEKINDNEINLIASDLNTEIITKYIFENDAVVEIYVTQEVFSGDFVEDMYKAMQEDDEIGLVYEEIDLNGNIITMKLKQDYVNIYSGVTYEELYEDLNKSLNFSK